MGIAWMMLSIAAPAEADASAFDSAGYRIAHYRAPTRRAPNGVTRIAPQAAAMLRPGVDALFIDVTPVDPGAGGKPERMTIPGAHWFPESGRGGIDPAVERWLIGGVTRLTAGRADMPVIVFCLADCWMSWNAARRLQRAGYRPIWWLAEGSDGWRDLGLRLEPVSPECKRPE